ncbi:vitellogenin [Pimephales promelas]|nr:vitellogenin [Pimephales promelas]
MEFSLYTAAVAAANLKAARNIKEVNAERITPIVPEVVVVQHSQEKLTSMMSPGDLTVKPLPEEPEMRTIGPVHRTLCSVVPHIGVKACMEIMSSDVPAVDGLELEVKLGPRAAKKLLKEINIVDAETPKVKIPVHLKGGQRNNNSRPTSRVQIIVVSIAVKDNWKMCADGILPSRHKAAARIAWGEECQQYAISINAGIGQHGSSPMAYLKVKYEKVPRIIITYAKSLAEYIPGAAQMTGLAISYEKNSERQIELFILVPTERALDVIIKTPKMTTSKSNLVLPIALPFEAVQAYPEEDVMNIIQNLYTEASSAKCSVVRKSLATFNRRVYNYEIPLSCYQVLVQDCTSEHKFVVLMKKENVFEHEDLNIKVSDIDVDIYHQESAVKVKVNGIDVPTKNISYQHPTGTIRIEQKGQGVALYAPGHGLQEVYYSSDQWKIYVADWMKGQTCGLCGKADGAIRQEHTTPSGYLTESSVSFAHSWVLPAESCRDASQCHMKLESVKLEKQVILNGQESICRAVHQSEPSLSLLDTTACPLVNSNLNMFDGIYEKSVDLRETTDAHVACRCSEQCA